MPTNNFEKRVQEELNDFSLQPKEEVWLIVRERIRERKRRHVLWFWLPIGFLLGLGILFGIRSFQPRTEAVAESTPIPKIEKNNPKNRRDPAETEYPIKPEGPSGEKFKPKQTLPVQSNKEEWVVGEEWQEFDPFQKPFTEKADIFRANRKPFSINPKQHRFTLQTKKEEASKTPSPKRNSIEFQIGSFGLGGNLFGGFKAFENLSSSPGSGNNQAPSIVPESPLRSGIALGLGYTRKFPWGRNKYFQTGLGLSYFQTARRVGNYRDTIGTPSFSNTANYRGYYLGGSSQTFHSKYLFLEIPASIQWRLSKRAKSPLLLETGISYARLLYANGLAYGGTGYFQDKDLVNPNQLALRLGFDIALRPKRLPAFDLGFQIRSSISTFYKPEVPVTAYGRSISIRLRKHF